jgi:hypothetical protein
VPFPKFVVELIEWNAPVALRHVVKSFPNRGDILVKWLRMQLSPFIKYFFWGQVGPVGTELVAEKAVELAKFVGHFGRHGFLLRSRRLILPKAAPHYQLLAGD